MSQFIDPEYMHLERVNELGREIIRVRDEEGDYLFDLPGALPDECVNAVVAVINRAYSVGFSGGEHSRSREFARLLTIKSEALND